MLRLCNPKILSSRLILRCAAVLLLILFLYAHYLGWSSDEMDEIWITVKARLPVAFRANHPIKKLMADARDFHEQRLARRTYDLEATAARYREVRGRHPPPGFDQWFAAAKASDAVLVEEYFDRIYTDLAPFWGLDPTTLAQRASSWEHVVKVRNGAVTRQGNYDDLVEWLPLWSDLVAEFSEYLPDVDMPINYMDESRVLAPYNTVETLRQQELDNRELVDPADVTTNFTGLDRINSSQSVEPYQPEWLHDGPYWDLAVQACPPDSAAHGIAAQTDYSPAVDIPQQWQPSYAYKGFVQNWSQAIDPCTQPHLRQMHGTFVEPISIATTQEVIPMFGGCKLTVNNEITIPGAMYLTKAARYSGGNTHGPSWDKKRDGLVWRGVDSGGRAHHDNWYHLQRHRFVEMLNGTTVSRIERAHQRELSFDLPPLSMYPSTLQARGDLGAWLDEFADAGFVAICAAEADDCGFLRDHLTEVPAVSMATQYKYKFLPDVDGNSFSARFRGFLLSTSLPLKASIYAEWHDDRLVPWLHFAPLDNTMQDLYPVLEFFADKPGGRGDAAARFIAEEGKAWAEKVLRRDDMKLYVWRLLLEWARVCDEKRHTLGYIGDLL